MGMGDASQVEWAEGELVPRSPDTPKGGWIRDVEFALQEVQVRAAAGGSKTGAGWAQGSQAFKTRKMVHAKHFSGAIAKYSPIIHVPYTPSMSSRGIFRMPYSK